MVSPLAEAFSRKYPTARMLARDQDPLAVIALHGATGAHALHHVAGDDDAAALADVAQHQRHGATLVRGPQLLVQADSAGVHTPGARFAVGVQPDHLGLSRGLVRGKVRLVL